MDGVSATSSCCLDEQVGAQVGLRRRVAGECHGGIGLGDVRRSSIGVGVHGDGGDPEIAARAHHPPSHPAPVGD